MGSGTAPARWALRHRPARACCSPPPLPARRQKHGSYFYSAGGERCSVPVSAVSRDLLPERGAGACSRSAFSSSKLNLCSQEGAEIKVQIPTNVKAQFFHFIPPFFYMIQIHLSLFPLSYPVFKRPDDCCFENLPPSKLVLRCRVGDKKAAINHQEMTEVSHVFSNQETSTALIPFGSDTFPTEQVQPPPLPVHTLPPASARAADTALPALLYCCSVKKFNPKLYHYI